MANQTITVRVEDTDIRTSGRRLTDFPATGTYVQIEKVSANATVIEGLNGTWVAVGSNGTLRRVTITVIQHSDDDVFLANGIAALQAGPNVIPISIKYGAIKAVSAGCVVETEPTHELAADGSANVVYVFVGPFPGLGLVNLEAPHELTEDEINGV